VVEHDQKGSRLVTFVDLRTSRRFRNAALCDNEDCSRHMDRGDMKVQGPEQCQSDLVQGRHDLDCRDQGCRSTTTFLRMTSWQCGRLEKFKTPQFGTFSFSTPSSSLKAATPSSSGRYCHHQIHAMTKTRVGGVKVKIGYVNQKQWLAQGGIAEHSIKTTGAVATKPSWVTRTWISIANGTLKEWQVDYLVSINFPMTKEENDRRRKAGIGGFPFNGILMHTME